MKEWRDGHAIQAESPVDVQDVEDEIGEQKGEESRGEELLEVNVHDAKGRGVEYRREREEDLGRVLPEAGVATRMRNIGNPGCLHREKWTNIT